MAIFYYLLAGLLLLNPWLSLAWPGSPASAAPSRPVDPAGLVLYPDLSSTAPPVSASAAVLMDATTGAVLYQREALARRHPASTTKIMTALLALIHGDPEDAVVISRRAAGTPGSTANLAAGETYRLGDLLYGLMLPSGNDAAVAIAEHISGSEQHFVALMNEYARKLNMMDTHFENPHGLTHPDHLSTAYDLALLTRQAVNHQEFLEITCSRWHQTCPADGGRPRRWHNTNKLLWSFPFTEGGKTGTTSAAGPCLIVVARQGGHRLIAVVLNSRDRWADARELLRWGFEQFDLVQVARSGDRVQTVNIAGGTVPEAPVTVARDFFVVVPKTRRSQVRLRIEVPPVVRAPLGPGEPVGTMLVELDGEPVAWTPLRIAHEVGTMTLPRKIIAYALLMIRRGGL